MTQTAHKFVGSTIRMTAQQFLQLGEDPPGVRLELVDGEIIVSPSPIPNHSYALLKLARLIDEYVERQQLGQVFSDIDSILDDYNVRRPDISFYAADRLHLIGEKALEGPADLCVEVVSPSSIQVDQRDKFDQYARAGVAHYWIVDPARRTAEGYALREGSYRLTASGRDADVLRLPPFVDLELPLGRLWRPGG